jgi:pheophorbide a oxygenase
MSVLSCRLEFGRHVAGREAHASLVFYAVPVAPGRSRIISGYCTDALPPALRRALRAPALAPLLHAFQWAADLGQHEVLDGDTLLLHRQERQAAQQGGGRGGRARAPRYFMPTASDAGVREFQRWMHREAGGRPAYGPAAAQEPRLLELDRNQILDRYDQHTRLCPYCRPVRGCEARGACMHRLGHDGVPSTSRHALCACLQALRAVRLIGAGLSLGTSAALAAALVLAILRVAAPQQTIPRLAVTPPAPFAGASAALFAAGAALAGAALNHAVGQLERRFVFVDYDHSRK